MDGLYLKFFMFVTSLRRNTELYRYLKKNNTKYFYLCSRRPDCLKNIKFIADYHNNATPGRVPSYTSNHPKPGVGLHRHSFKNGGWRPNNILVDGQSKRRWRPRGGKNRKRLHAFKPALVPGGLKSVFYKPNAATRGWVNKNNNKKLNNRNFAPRYFKASAPRVRRFDEIFFYKKPVSAPQVKLSPSERFLNYKTNSLCRPFAGVFTLPFIKVKKVKKLRSLKKKKNFNFKNTWSRRRFEEHEEEMLHKKLWWNSYRGYKQKNRFPRFNLLRSSIMIDTRPKYTPFRRAAYLPNAYYIKTPGPLWKPLSILIKYNRIKNFRSKYYSKIGRPFDYVLSRLFRNNFSRISRGGSSDTQYNVVSGFSLNWAANFIEKRKRRFQKQLFFRFRAVLPARGDYLISKRKMPASAENLKLIDDAVLNSLAVAQLSTLSIQYFFAAYYHFFRKALNLSEKYRWNISVFEVFNLALVIAAEQVSKGFASWRKTPSIFASSGHFAWSMSACQSIMRKFKKPSGPSNLYFNPFFGSQSNLLLSKRIHLHRPSRSSAQSEFSDKFYEIGFGSILFKLKKIEVRARRVRNEAIINLKGSIGDQQQRLFKVNRKFKQESGLMRAQSENRLPWTIFPTNRVEYRRIVHRTWEYRIRRVVPRIYLYFFPEKSVLSQISKKNKLLSRVVSPFITNEYVEVKMAGRLLVGSILKAIYLEHKNVLRRRVVTVQEISASRRRLELYAAFAKNFVSLFVDSTVKEYRDYTSDTVLRLGSLPRLRLFNHDTVFKTFKTIKGPMYGSKDHIVLARKFYENFAELTKAVTDEVTNTKKATPSHKFFDKRFQDWLQSLFGKSFYALRSPAAARGSNRIKLGSKFATNIPLRYLNTNVSRGSFSTYYSINRTSLLKILSLARMFEKFNNNDSGLVGDPTSPSKLINVNFVDRAMKILALKKLINFFNNKSRVTLFADKNEAFFLNRKAPIKKFYKLPFVKYLHMYFPRWNELVKRHGSSVAYEILYTAKKMWITFNRSRARKNSFGRMFTLPGQELNKKRFNYFFRLAELIYRRGLLAGEKKNIPLRAINVFNVSNFRTLKHKIVSHPLPIAQTFRRIEWRNRSPLTSIRGFFNSSNLNYFSGRNDFNYRSLFRSSLSRQKVLGLPKRFTKNINYYMYDRVIVKRMLDLLTFRKSFFLDYDSMAVKDGFSPLAHETHPRNLFRREPRLLKFRPDTAGRSRSFYFVQKKLWWQKKGNKDYRLIRSFSPFRNLSTKRLAQLSLNRHFWMQYGRRLGASRTFRLKFIIRHLLRRALNCSTNNLEWIWKKAQKHKTKWLAYYFKTDGKLGNYLKICGLVSSTKKGAAAVSGGLIYVNGVVCFDPDYLVSTGDVISLNNEAYWRGLTKSVNRFFKRTISYSVSPVNLKKRFMVGALAKIREEANKGPVSAVMRSEDKKKLEYLKDAFVPEWYLNPTKAEDLARRASRRAPGGTHILTEDIYLADLATYEIDQKFDAKNKRALAVKRVLSKYFKFLESARWYDGRFYYKHFNHVFVTRHPVSAKEMFSVGKLRKSDMYSPFTINFFLGSRFWH